MIYIQEEERKKKEEETERGDHGCVQKK